MTVMSSDWRGNRLLTRTRLKGRLEARLHKRADNCSRKLPACERRIVESCGAARAADVPFTLMFGGGKISTSHTLRPDNSVRGTHGERDQLARADDLLSMLTAIVRTTRKH